jgi:perosamine synthetase
VAELTNSFSVPKNQFPSWETISLSKRQNHLTDFANPETSYYCFWARNAIFLSLKACGLLPGDEVLVPAYICAVAVEPIIAYGAVAVFYDTLKNCTPNFADIVEKIGHRTRALVGVHYFGFAQKIRELEDVCRKHRLFLIEDCAHVLSGEVGGRRLGSFGAASVFSWRKFLPIYDGAHLILNHATYPLKIDWCREHPLLTLKVAKDILDQIFLNNHNRLIKTSYRALDYTKDLLFRSSPTLVQRPGTRIVDSNSLSFDISKVNFSISRISKRLIGHSDVSRIIQKRRRNYLILLEELAAIPGLHIPFPDLVLGVCPWVFPIIFEDMPNALRSLREAGIPAANWCGVRPRLPRNAFPHAEFLYDNLIFLPLHQNLRDEHLRTVIRAVKALRESSPCR